MANRKSEFRDQFLIRLPDGVRERIAEVARREMRSLNGQINFWLQAGLNAVGTKDDDARSK